MTGAAENASQQTQATKTLASGASLMFGGRAAGKLLQAIAQVVLARLLGPELFGLYAVGWTIISLIPWFGALGLDRTVIRFGAPYRAESPARFKGLILYSVGLSLIGGLAFSIATFLLAPWLATSVFHKPDLVPVLRWFAAAFMFAAGVQTVAAAARITQRMKDSMLTEDFLPAAINLALILIFFLLGWEIPGVFIAVVVANAISLAVGMSALYRLFPELSVSERPAPIFSREIWLFTAPVAFAGIANTMLTWSDRLIVGFLRPASEVGIYQAASSASMLLSLILGSFTAVFTPMIADMYHRGETKRLDELFKITTKWGLYLCFPIFVVMWLQSRDMMMVIFGADYAGGALPLIVLSIGQLINVATGTVGAVLVMTGHQNRWLLLLGFALLTEIVVAIVFTPMLGPVGAAIGSTVSLALLMGAGVFEIRRLVHLWPYDRRFGKGIVAAVLAMIAVLLVRMGVEPLVPLMRLALGSITAAAVFSAALLLMGIDDEDRSLFESMLARLKRKRIAPPASAENSG
jgi:O-antigen/teichoic acid export membrane protein